MKWFRFYSEALHDPKLLALSDAQYRFWVNLLCLANDSVPRGVLPDAASVAVILRMKTARAEELIGVLVEARLVDRDETGRLCPHNWDSRQFGSDANSLRVVRYRERIRSNGESVTGYAKHRAFVLERDGFACVYCGATGKLVLDHLVPVIRGGDGQVDNLVTACRSCNSGKSGRLVEETNYRIIRPEIAAQYVSVKSRLGVVTGVNRVTPVTVTGHGGVTVTGVNRVTPVTPRARADSDSDSDSEPPQTPSRGGVRVSDGSDPAPNGTPPPNGQAPPAGPAGAAGPIDPAWREAVETADRLFPLRDFGPMAYALRGQVRPDVAARAFVEMKAAGKASWSYWGGIVKRLGAEPGPAPAAPAGPAAPPPPPTPSAADAEDAERSRAKYAAMVARAKAKAEKGAGE